jgi:hypothetical protein
MPLPNFPLSSLHFIESPTIDLIADDSSNFECTDANSKTILLVLGKK